MKVSYLTTVAVVLLTIASSHAQTHPQAPVPRSRYSPMAAAQAQGQTPRQPDTWYEFLLKQFNPHNFNYGAWIEERRRALLEATAKSASFDYGVVITLVALFMMIAYAKLWVDGRRKGWVTSEMMTDLYNQDAQSREVARAAIRRYNDHIEVCNRAIEAVESGQPVPGAGFEVEELRVKLRETQDKLEAVTAERDRLRAEAEKKSARVAEMSLRLEALSQQGGGNGHDAAPVGTGVGQPSSESDPARLVKHINYLQEQLYAERKKNERLKGA